MENVFVYGGYILTSGVLDSGNPWKGINIMLAPVDSTSDKPVISYVYKASRTNKAVLDACKTLAVGSYVVATFSAPDYKGRSKVATLTSAEGGV